MKIDWECLDCNTLNTSDTNDHHKLNMCKSCGKSGVDAETYMIRRLGNVKLINELIVEEYYNDK